MYTRFQQLIFKSLPSYVPFLLHSGAWILYASLVVYVNNVQGVDFVVGHPSIHIFAQAAIFYGNYYYLIPTLLAQQKFFSFLLFNLLCITGLVSAFIPAFHLLRNWYLGSVAAPFPLPYAEQFLLRFFELLLFAFVACLIRFTVDWFSFQQKSRDQENFQLKTELALLRSQLNPHFLFNTLNALYALAIKQSAGTSDAIMQLSELMRYLLYETNEERVSLSKEVEMIDNFLELQKLRLPLDFGLQFEIRGDIGEIYIEPLLLMSIVENIFKHGTEFASILLSVTKSTLTMVTHNGIMVHTTGDPGGIGLKNLQRRLSHLYPDKHRWQVEKIGDQFQTTLSLTLN